MPTRQIDSRITRGPSEQICLVSIFCFNILLQKRLSFLGCGEIRSEGFHLNVLSCTFYIEMSIQTKQTTRKNVAFVETITASLKIREHICFCKKQLEEEITIADNRHMTKVCIHEKFSQKYVSYTYCIYELH